MKSRLVNILPDEALEKDEKASLSKIGRSPTTSSFEGTNGPTTEEHSKPENPDEADSVKIKIPPRRRRVSVTDRLQSMMTDSSDESSGQSSSSPSQNK